MTKPPAVVEQNRRALGDLRGRWRGEDCIVIGCGPSAKVDPRLWSNFWTIACNRSAADRGVHDFGLCVEPPEDQAVWRVIVEANPTFILTYRNPKLSPEQWEAARGWSGEGVHPRLVELGHKSDVRPWIASAPVTDFWPHQQRFGLAQSTFYGITAAVALGFERVGVIGLDLTADRYSDADLAESSVMYGALADLARRCGSDVVNLSDRSRLSTIPRATWDTIGWK